MSKEEARHFKLFIKRTNANSERKDATLFDYIRKSLDGYEEAKILKKLYDKKDKNAFYRLKNRLLEDLGKSLSLQYFDHFASNQALHYLALSRLHQDKGQFKVAIHYLNRAEKKAMEIQSYELLDVIYSDLIKVSQETLSINPENYIEKRKENRLKLNRLREIDDILAVLIYRIRLSQNFSPQNYQIIEVLQKTINDFSHSKEIKQSPQLRFKIYHSVSRILLQQHDYKALEDYLILTLKEFSKEKLFNRNNHDTKLQMLTYLVNSLFKNGKQKLSLEYAEKLKEAMNEFNGILHDKYLFYYYSALINNYSIINTEKAIVILNEALENKKINEVSLNRVFLYLQLALLHFDNREIKQANKHIVKLKLEDSFKTLDEAFQLKINIAELIIRYELEDSDFIELQLKNIRKEFRELLEKEDHTRQRDILGIISDMIYSPNVKADKKLHKTISDVIKAIPPEEASDTDILNYHDWLKGKIN